MLRQDARALDRAPAIEAELVDDALGMEVAAQPLDQVEQPNGDDLATERGKFTNAER